MRSTLDWNAHDSRERDSIAYGLALLRQKESPRDHRNLTPEQIDETRISPAPGGAEQAL
jgi:hypothetical protein